MRASSSELRAEAESKVRATTLRCTREASEAAGARLSRTYDDLLAAQGSPT